MGREVKRVPLNFQWPINEIWKGYVNPIYAEHSHECPHCDGHGATSGRKRLEDLVGLLMLSGSDASRGKSHPYFENMEGLYCSQGITPSEDLAKLTAGLAGRNCSGFGHDACDRWEATRKILRAAGIKSEKWGYCPHCKGSGRIWDSRNYEIRSNRWRRKEPPKGAGYQMWETTSEGSPISPVFKTPEELAQWLASTGASSFGRDTATYETWLAFIRGPGWAPSMIVSSRGARSGVEAAVDP